MINRHFKILLIALILVCAFPYAVLGAKIDGYTTITGTFENIENGISTESVVQALIIKDELLTEGKISAEFSNNVKIADHPVGIAFAGKGIREYESVSGSGVCYLTAHFDGSSIVLGKNEHGIAEPVRSASVDDSFFDSDTVKLAVSFSADGEVKIFVNDSEIINTSLPTRLLYGGEFGIFAGGGKKFEITNITATSLSHTEHTAGDIISEIHANCVSSGKMEHSVCTVCGEPIYQKEGVWTVTTDSELIIPKDPDNHVDSEESAEWTYDEAKHTKSCRCGTVLVSENHDIDVDALEGTCSVCGYNKIHTCDDLTRIYATPGNCVTKGKKEHYKCNDCEKLYIRSGNSYVEKTEEELEVEIDAYNHIDSAEELTWTYDNSRHFKTCRCGEIISSGKHGISSDALEGTCTVCGYVKAHVCTYTKIPEVEANCITKGRKLHYKCSDCGRLYVKNGGIYTVTSEKELVIPESTENHIDSVKNLTWAYDDHAHTKTCRCGTVLAKGNHSISATALSGTCTTCGYVRTHTCTYTEIPEVPSDCMNRGKIAHYKCKSCEKLYVKNGEGYTRIYADDLDTPKDISNHVDSVNALEWTHDNISHKKICRCGAVLVSEKHDIDASALEGACTVCGYFKAHSCTYTKIPEVKADCITKGRKLHYKCSDCGKLYIKTGDEYSEASEKELEIPENSENHIDSARNLEWAYDDHTHTKTCRCGAILAKGNHSISATALNGSCVTCGYVRTHTCTYTAIPEVPSDCMNKGKIAHYKCEACQKLYIKNGEGYTRIYAEDLDTPKDSSNHVDSVSALEWTGDESGHKKVCRCKAVLAFEEHDIDADVLEDVCSVCGYFKAHTCTYTKIPEVKANCVTKGERLHYKCNECGKFYIKTGGEYTETSEKELEILENPENHIDSVRNLEWAYDDYTHTKTCRCGRVLASGKHSISDSALSGSCVTCGYVRTHSCTYTEIPEVTADCMNKGKMAHYKCEVCKKLYVRKGESYERIYAADLDILKDTSNHVDSVDTLPWTYDENTHKKTCRCGEILVSEAHSILPDKEACTVCSYERSHVCEYAYISAKPSDCITNGIKEHYKCLSCGKIYLIDQDKYVEVSIEDITVEASHKLIRIDAVIGSCISESVKEYYKCEICGRLFSDEKAESEIENIPKGEKDPLNHTDSNNDGRCDICLQGDSNDQSGENGEKTEERLVYYLLIAAVTILFILCLLLLIIIKRLLKNKVK